MAKQQTNPDVRVVNNGSIFTFYTDTDAAREWVNENVHIESHMSMGDTGFHCEHRMAHDIAQGMLDAGLVVE